MPEPRPLLDLHKPIIGMIHVLPLPGTPAYGGSMAEVIDRAAEEARLYREAGIDALGVENMHDTPYLRGGVGPEITAAMATVCGAVKRESGALPCGVQILAGANREALAVALSAGLDFVRVEGFVFAHVGDEGTHESCAGELLRFRAAIGAGHVRVLTDIKKKHCAHAITADVDIAETARAAALFRSDGLVVSGRATGVATDVEDVETVAAAVALPVLVGSGVTVENVERYLPRADGLIVGSHFKRDGLWRNPLDPGRVAAFVDRVGTLRG
jgi:hypothetical protein